MATLLIQLVGPMQSWGTTSRFDQRDTGKEPSKSGVIGLLAAAMGIDRGNWAALEPLAKCAMGVRHDRAGIPRRDYQTAGCAKNDTVIKADGKPSRDGVVSRRNYLADAAFLVGLQSSDRPLLQAAHGALKDPVWPLSLGRKSYLPSEPIWIKDGLQDGDLSDVLKGWPWITSQRRWESAPKELLLTLEFDDGSGLMKMDQPLASFAERRFGARYVRSEWVDFPGGEPCT